jgi:hypothetical protein
MVRSCTYCRIIVLIHLISPGLNKHIASLGLCFISVPVAFAIIFAVLDFSSDYSLPMVPLVSFIIVIPFGVIELAWIISQIGGLL